MMRLLARAAGAPIEIQTLVAFALGFTLFVMTLLLNIYALYIVRKYKEQYE